MHFQTDRKLTRLSFLLAVFLFAAVTMFAQSVTSGLTGTVTDPQGAVVPGADVVLTEPSTGATKTFVTDSNGNYSFQEIKPGTYQIKISKDGFTAFVADNVLVENLQTRRIDAALKVGGAAETVTVDAGAAVITTEGGTITSSFGKDRVADNPSIDTYPSPYSLFTTLPGVQGNGWDLRVSGQAPSQQTIGLDGVINDRFGEQNNNINFYEEANITTVNATADNPRVVNYNLVSKRGQNQFRGSAYYKRFDSTFNARDYWDPTKTYQVQHEAQIEASGPIFKNKTFFYASWFYHRIPTGGPRFAFVPTQRMRNGDFSDFLGHSDPNDDTIIYDPQTGDPFPGNVIPTQRLNAVALKFQNYYPLPNADLDNGNFAWHHNFADDYFRASFPFIRIDHNFNSKNSLYGKWTQRKTPYVLDYNNLPGFFWTRLRDHSQLSATDTHIFKANLVNSFTFGWSRDYIEDGKETAGQKPLDGNEVLADTGLQGMNPGGLEGSGFPAMNIDNVRALSVAVAGGVKNHDHTFSFEDNVTWTKRNHSFKFGGDLTQFKTFSGEVPNYGSLNFNGFASGIPYADFLLGIPSRSTRNSPRINRERSIKEIGLYATDSFKVTPNLTLDLGLRWDYYGPATYKDGLQYNFDRETGNVIIPNGTRGEVDPLYPAAINIVEGQVVPKADKGNFRPRIAVAYRFGDDFVLRGGYGAFTERFSRFYTDFALGGGPFSRFSEAYDNSIVNGVPLFSFPNPFPPNQAGRRPAGAQSVAGVPLKSDDGVIHQFNISLEKEIFGLGLRGSYIGSRGTGLRAWTQLNARRPGTNINSPIPKLYPQFATGIALGGGASGVNYVRDDFGSSYDSIQVEVQRRKGEFTFDAHYTYAIDKDNINKTPNPFEPTSVWARNDVTRKHLAVVTTTWHLPVGKGKRFLSDANSAIDTILGGWKLQTVSYFGSGKYFTPYDCGHNQTLYGSFDGIYGGGCIRPDAVSDGNLPRGERTVNRWFDYTAFATPSPGTYGNAKTNSLVGPGLHVHHLSLAKTFAFSERFRLTYTASISNIFNTPNFYQPDGDLYCAEGDYCGATLYYTLGVGGGAPENGGHRTVAMKLKFDF